MTAKPVLEQAGFAGVSLNIALGVSYAESGGYADAVGDVTLIGEKWGPSIGLFQIRSLRHPEDYPFPDTLRIAEPLRDPWYNAAAAWEISRHGTYWTPWSVYNHGTYLPHVGKDYPILTGHRNAHLWNI